MARAALGWTLKDLADRAGINVNTISRYEAGSEILTGTMQKIDDVLRSEGVVFLMRTPNLARASASASRHGNTFARRAIRLRCGPQKEGDRVRRGSPSPPSGRRTSGNLISVDRPYLNAFLPFETTNGNGK